MLARTARSSVSLAAGLLRRAASVLDPPDQTPAPRRPGQPPEHWLALVTAHAPGLLRDAPAPDEGVRPTAYPGWPVASDLPAPVTSSGRPLPTGPALVTPPSPSPDSHRIRDLGRILGQDSTRIPDPVVTSSRPGTPVPLARRTPGAVDPPVARAVVTPGREVPVGPARWPALPGEPPVAPVRWSTADTGSAVGEVRAARVTTTPPLPVPPAVRASASHSPTSPRWHQITDPGRILDQDSTRIPDPVVTRARREVPMAPARRTAHPVERSAPDAASPWPELPDDAELWSAVPPLFTPERVARLDREQAGG
ncbi:hypothetical protein AB0H43_29600 [Hamadaea sp. NPDC050747]|uniref:hypothetical protein n=1 Tax=Hamadaea sp. NPDC050747 TaxID=3155789 RepID=UPI0033DE0B1D